MSPGPGSLRVLERTWLDTLVARCQALAGRALDRTGAQLWYDVRELTAGMPTTLTVRERVLVRTQLTITMAHMLRLAGIEERPDIAAGFFSWIVSDIAGREWCDCTIRFIDACASAARSTLAFECQGDHSHTHVASALRFIESQFSDRDMSLEEVAEHIDLSVWHTARLLKQHTGVSFKPLLHRRRVRAAQKLLSNPALGLKEIATAVGYATHSQLSVQFKRFAGLTPSQFRARVSVGGTIAEARSRTERDVRHDKNWIGIARIRQP